MFRIYLLSFIGDDWNCKWRWLWHEQKNHIQKCISTYNLILGSHITVNAIHFEELFYWLFWFLSYCFRWGFSVIDSVLIAKLNLDLDMPLICTESLNSFASSCSLKSYPSPNLYKTTVPLPSHHQTLFGQLKSNYFLIVSFYKILVS